MEGVEIIPLGGGCEVGRSCIMLNIKGKNIMLDCGIHPSDNDTSSLPFFDKIEPSEIDLMLITHFHLDHCGAIPYFLSKTKFKAPTLMTFPTKAIYKHLLLDSLKIEPSEGSQQLYDRQDVLDSMSKITPINFHEQIEIDGIKITAYNAGHVIGAAMFVIEVGSVSVLYTGDYSREEDIHLQPAEIPPSGIDIVIVESTYGIKTHEPREAREKFFLESVEKIVKRNGKCLLPVFVLGRSQELLLLMEEYWSKKTELQQVPIYFPSQLLTKCMTIFQTYINMMGRRVRERMRRGDNPFDFKHVKVVRGVDGIIASPDPLVVMSSPGMLQQGISRILFQKWCHDERNGVIFTGYCVENTLARDILNGKREIKNEAGNLQPIKMTVDHVSFSAHSDYPQTQDFIEQVRPKLVVLVHGEKTQALRLKKHLEDHFGESMRIEAPMNWQKVFFKPPLKHNCIITEDTIEGIKKLKFTQNEPQEHVQEAYLIKKKFKYFVCQQKELSQITGQKLYHFNQKVIVTFPHSFDLAYYLIAQIYPKAQTAQMEGQEIISVEGQIVVKHEGVENVAVLWAANEMNDTIGYCICFLLDNIGQVSEIDMFSNDVFGRAATQDEKFEGLLQLLEGNFGPSNIDHSGKDIVILNNNSIIAQIDKLSFEVKTCADDAVSERIFNLVKLS